MEPTFRVGDLAVYPAHGVAQIVGIETREISSNKQTFYILKILERICGAGSCEAARIATRWSLLEVRGYGSRRWDRFNDDAVDLVPDLVVRFVGKDCTEQRLDVVEVDAVGSDSGAAFYYIGEKMLASTLGAK